MLAFLLSSLVLLAWYLPNRPAAGRIAMPADTVNSVSFAPYRAGQSPLTRIFPSAADVDQDLALMAGRTRAIRTYAAIEGHYDLPAMARRHGLKIWQGIWLGPNRADNARELAAGIAAARANPDVIERVVVGNEVLLRRDLPPDELIAAIDQVRHAVRQKVTYADVWNFFVANPQVVRHLDILTIHILPYWEDEPTNIDGAIAHVADVVARMSARFPAIPIAIGETGWPSRGRWRQDAAPGLVNQVIFLRRFIALAQSRHFDYNVIEGFDQIWKYRNEGVVGASWGLWTAARTPKFPLAGPVRENPSWLLDAALSILCGGLLYAQAAASGQGGQAGAARAMLLGAALGYACAGTGPVLFDIFARIAGAANLAGQAALALLFLNRGPAAPRTGRDATGSVRALLRLRWPAGWRGAMARDAILDDLAFIFLWAATVDQLLLLYDPRYRDFPLPSYAVPIVVTALRLRAPRCLTPADRVLGATLALAAFGSLIREGPLNLQSLAWNACALLLAAPLLHHRFPSARSRPIHVP